MPVTRHFFDWNQPLLPAVADYVIERYAEKSRLDLRNVVVVFTGARASRRMLELLFEKASRKWPAFMPPRLVTFRYFPEMLYKPKRPFAEDLTQLLIWKNAIQAIPQSELAVALPQIPSDDAIPAWLALCSTLQTQHNELAEEGIDFNDVTEALKKLENRDEAKRWEAFNKLQAEYLVQVDQMGLWDRQTSRLVAVDQQECQVDFDILLVGTADMNRVVQQMLDQVADRVTALIHAPESEADAFDAYGCLHVESWSNRKLNIDSAATRIAENPAEQAAIAVREIAALAGTRRADEISIGIADDSLVPAVLQQLSDAGVAGRWPVGMQLQDSRPWRLLSGIVDHLSSARGGLPPDFATLSDLVRHPDVTAWIEARIDVKIAGHKGASADWLTELDNYIARHLQASPGVLLGTRPRRELIGGILAAVESLLSHLCPHEVDAATDGSSRVRSQQLLFDDQVDVVSRSLNSQLESRLPLNVWAKGVLRMLNALYQDYELQPDDFRDHGISACCEALSDAAEVLSRVPASVMLRCTAAQAIQFLLKQTRDTNIPPVADDQAIDLLGWLELAMDDSPVLLLTGFNEGFVPESVTSDVFLPNTLRTTLGLRDNRRRYARDAYLVTAMLNSREQFIFIAGRTDPKGNPLAPSRLWFAADADSLPARVQRFYDSDPQASDITAAAPSVANDAAPASADEAPRRLSGFTIPRPIMIPQRPKEIPVTAFREYLECPYRYFLKRELRLRPVEDETLELAAPAFGSLIHDVLNEFGQSAYVDSTTPESIEAYLLKTLSSIATSRFGKTRSATVSVQLQMVQNRLTAFAHWQAKTASEGWRIQHSEKALRYESFEDSRGRNVVLAGRVDRIDQHHKTGRWRVLDYKSSERADPPEATHVKKKEWVDLQLPLYRLLVRSLGVYDDLELGYVHLPGDLTKVGASIAKWTAGDLASAEETAKQIAAHILDLRIDRVEPGQEHRSTEFARVCQDSVIDRNIPWLEDWGGRSGG